MRKRLRITLFWWFFMILLAFVLLSWLRARRAVGFSKANLMVMINGESRVSHKLDDLCLSGLLGEPDVGDKYIKIIFDCGGGRKVVSTLALTQFDKLTVKSVLDSYGQLVNFNGKVSEQRGWNCSLNMERVDIFDDMKVISDASVLECRK